MDSEKVRYNICEEIDTISGVSKFIAENDIDFTISAIKRNDKYFFVWEVELSGEDASYLMLTNSEYSMSKCQVSQI